MFIPPWLIIMNSYKVFIPICEATDQHHFLFTECANNDEEHSAEVACDKSTYISRIVVCFVAYRFCSPVSTELSSGTSYIHNKA